MKPPEVIAEGLLALHLRAGFCNDSLDCRTERGKSLQLQNYLSWLGRIDLLSLLIGAALGAFASTWHGHFVRRPKLRVTGTSGGGFVAIRIRNEPGFIGLRLRETTLLGFHIHSPKEFGLVIDRSAAHECSAVLIDKQTRQQIRALWWWIGDTTVQNVTLESGSSAELMVLSRQGAEPGKYYVWQRGDDPLVSIPPPGAAQFEGSREFVIEVLYAYGHKRTRFPFSVVKRFDGSEHYRCPAGSGSF